MCIRLRVTLSQVTAFTKTMPGGLPVSGFASSSDDTGTSGAATPALTIVNIDVSALVVPVPAATAVTGPPPVDLSRIVDTVPPNITLLGASYVSVLETSTYTDSGVQVRRLLVMLLLGVPA